jgi:thiol-disulfide isomerase/thioredoxin
MPILILYKYCQGLLILSFLLFNDGCKCQSFILNGTIKGKESGYAVLYFRDIYNHPQKIFSTIRSGKFQFSGSVSGFDYSLLDTDTNSIKSEKNYAKEIFIEPGTMSITFTNGEADKAIITGSKSQAEFELLRKSRQKEKSELDSLLAILNTVDSRLRNNSIDVQAAEKRTKEINEKIFPLVQLLNKTDFEYVKAHPDSYVSLNLLYYLIGRMPDDSIDVYYFKLGDKVKSSSFGYRFNEYYRRYKKALGSVYSFDKINEGKKAPDFKIYNQSGKDTMTLESYHGKVVVLEFWGLYCYPCLKANSELKEVCKKYNSSKLEIIAVNNNDDKDLPEIKNYLNKNNLYAWTHVFTNDGIKLPDKRMFQGDFSNYQGLGVPRTVLIDKNGKVICRNYGYSSEEMLYLKSKIEEALSQE